MAGHVVPRRLDRCATGQLRVRPTAVPAVVRFVMGSWTLSAVAGMGRREWRTGTATTGAFESVLALLAVDLATLLEAVAGAFSFLNDIGASPGVGHPFAVLLYFVPVSHVASPYPVTDWIAFNVSAAATTPVVVDDMIAIRSPPSGDSTEYVAPIPPSIEEELMPELRLHHVTDGGGVMDGSSNVNCTKDVPDDVPAAMDDACET